jgi:hypothetical protein
LIHLFFERGVLMPTQLTRALLDGIRDALIDTGAPLDGAKLHLLKEVPDLSVDTVFADLVVSDFGTYAAQTVVFAPAVDEDGHEILVAPPEVFSPDDADDLPQSVVGHAITTSANGLLFIQIYPVAVGLTAALQQVVATAKLDIHDVQAASAQAIMP